MVELEFLQQLPKCEHHCHIEGTLSPELLFHLAKTNNISLPEDFPNSVAALQARYDQFTGLDDFLQFYYIGMDVLITAKDFEELTYNYLVKCKEDGVVHAEISFDPQAHLARDVEFETIVDGITAARERAERELGVSSKLIMCVLRHLRIASGVQIVQKAAPFVEKGLIHALGLDSSEKGKHPEFYKPVYDEARAIGIERFTAHAGEEGPAEYVRAALDTLGVTRIDHGVRAADDEELLVRLAEEKVMLTTCPISNVQLQVLDHVNQSPYPKLLEFGVPFSINCDDPAYFGGYCLENYKQVDEAFKFDKQTWINICRYGIEGSWMDDDKRRQALITLRQLELL